MPKWMIINIIKDVADSLYSSSSPGLDQRMHVAGSEEKGI